MSGWAGLLNKKIKNILPRRELKGGRSARWETQKKYGHPNPHTFKKIIIYIYGQFSLQKINSLFFI